MVAGYDTAQTANAAMIRDVANAWGLGDHGALLGVMCAMGESSLRNIDYGDWETNGVRNPDGTPTSSIGLFQQQSWWGSPADRMDPVYAAWAFFDRLTRVKGWRTLAPTIAIHRVQINADPNHYARYETPARAVLASIPDLRSKGIIMADPLEIIECPWQPGMFGRRALIDALDRAGRPRINSMHRVYQDQKDAWNNSPAMGGKGSPADDPDRPESFELGHVRAIAADIDVTPENVRRLAAAGLVRPFSWEGWHWRLPGSVQKYPLMFGIPAAASSSAKPLTKGWLDMLSDQEQQELLEKVRRIDSKAVPVFDAIFVGGDSMKDGRRSLSDTVANQTEFLDRIDRNAQVVLDALLRGGDSMPDEHKALAESVALLRLDLVAVAEKLGVETHKTVE